MARNPFQQLYVGEKVDPEEFVGIFSHQLVPHAMPLFQPGHVVLTGVQGSGKTMLFKLLQTDVRLAFARTGQELPIGADAPRFIGAGINVNTARCNEFGNRRLDPSRGGTHELMFADFFNYIVVLDIIQSVKALAEDGHCAERLGLRRTEALWTVFVDALRSDDVWEGYLSETVNLDGMVARMRGRIAHYRRFLNANDRDLNTEVDGTKTSVGEPMKAAVRALRKAGVVPTDVEFYVLVDQYEELSTIKGNAGATDYRSVVNKLLNRDPTLSYRLGTRGYAWRSHVNVFGTDNLLEEDRDYKLIDLDAKLRNSEVKGTSIFPPFASDVFRRRLKWSSAKRNATYTGIEISDLLGRSMSPSNEARALAGKSPRFAITPDAQWPDAVRHSLEDLAETDPLSAKLGEVWLRQKGGEMLANIVEEAPWEHKQYWRKERVELALLQIAGRCKQRAIFAGAEDILALSGGNILLFLSICQSIWDLATPESLRRDAEPEYPIKSSKQTLGVFRAARAWVDRIPSDYGRSEDRYKLVQMLGRRFSIQLLGDAKMSNPGQNGLSFDFQDLRSNMDVWDFLVEAVDYGNLVMVEHTTRNKDRKRRYKFYLSPLYCPIYRIPYQRSKEPIYLTVEIFRKWLQEAEITDRIAPPRTSAQGAPSSAPLLELMRYPHG